MKEITRKQKKKSSPLPKAIKNKQDMTEKGKKLQNNLTNISLM